MGQVHVALDEQLRRRVALKTVARVGELAPDAVTLHRLQREARAAAFLNHPNAVSVYDIGEHGDITYIAMELVEGWTLRTYTNQDSNVPAPTKLAWMLDVARVLAEAHRLGLVHRDVKPENIMIRKDGIVKVLDFGIVKRIKRIAELPTTGDKTHELTAEGKVLGTPAYMSPETFEGVVGPHTDQFAWGVVTYELLAGKHPFDAPRGVSQYEWLLRSQAKHIGDVVQDMPRIAADTVMRAMDKRVEARFADMKVVVDTLATCLTGVHPIVPTDRGAITEPSDDAPTVEQIRWKR
jgi:serine/threonine-protein kinase